MPVDGGEARQLTKLPIDVSGPIWSPQGDKIAFAAEVYPGTTPEQTAAKDKEKEASKSKVRTFDRLMIRHWNAWDEGKRSHLFVADANTGDAHDLTPKLEVNTPPAPFGGSTDYAWSPDGKELAFTAEPVKDQAWSTNTDIWTVPADGGEPKNLTAANPAADAQPAYSPDGTMARLRQPGAAGLRVGSLGPAAPGSGMAARRSTSAPTSTGRCSRSPGRSANSLAAVIDSEGTEPIVTLPAPRALGKSRSDDRRGRSPAGPATRSRSVPKQRPWSSSTTLPTSPARSISGTEGRSPNPGP